MSEGQQGSEGRHRQDFADTNEPAETKTCKSVCKRIMVWLGFGLGFWSRQRCEKFLTEY
jgi:hypothetical protein